jgi:creatinine amidohydrolase
MSEGYSIFHETMADMTFPEVEAAARRGAVVLWALGVIEEHGPHLPLATDVYVPCATLREARTMLAERGIESVIAPPFYWGINAATAAFAGSFVVRPETMIELIKDVFRSLSKDGFSTVFCLSGHGDAAHYRVLLDGVKAGSAFGPIDAFMLVSPAFAKRLELDPNDPFLALTDPPASEPQQYVDVHAGDGETSMIWAKYPGVVRTEIVPTLAPTITSWRISWSGAKATSTPSVRRRTAISAIPPPPTRNAATPSCAARAKRSPRRSRRSSAVDYSAWDSVEARWSARCMLTDSSTRLHASPSTSITA